MSDEAEAGPGIDSVLHKIDRRGQPDEVVTGAIVEDDDVSAEVVVVMPDTVVLGPSA